MMPYLDLLLWAPVFIAGMVVGALAAMLLNHVRLSKERRTQLVAARARILTGIKEEREQETLRDIFKATDALKDEINQSLARFRKAVEPLLAQPLGIGESIESSEMQQLSLRAQREQIENESRRPENLNPLD